MRKQEAEKILESWLNPVLLPPSLFVCPASSCQDQSAQLSGGGRALPTEMQGERH